MPGKPAIFGTANEHADENEKLVELFWNRAELKKAFAALDREKYRLQERVREQQGATARVLQRLEHLESLLVDPEWVHTVVVSYQLRSLNRRCENKLAKFAEQLKQQREGRCRDVQLRAWSDKCNAKKAALEEKLAKHRERLQRIEGQLQAERQHADSTPALGKIFKRRSVSDRLSELSEQIDAARNEEQAFLQQIDSIEQAEPPDPEGLSVTEKRSINFMIIAFAQHLYLQFSDRNLVALVKESRDKSVGAVNYGSKRDCDVLLDRIGTHIDSMENASDYVDVLKRRAELVAEYAVFDDDDEPVPIAGTVATVFAIAGNGAVAKSDANLVGDNYWGIANVLSR